MNHLRPNLSYVVLNPLYSGFTSDGQSLFWWWSVGCSSFQLVNSVTTQVQSDNKCKPRNAKSVRDLFSASVRGVSLYVVVTSFE